MSEVVNGFCVYEGEDGVPAYRPCTADEASEQKLPFYRSRVDAITAAIVACRARLVELDEEQKGFMGQLRQFNAN